MQAVKGCCVHVGWQLGGAAASPFPEGAFPIDSPAAHLQEGATGRCRAGCLPGPETKGGDGRPPKACCSAF